MLNLRIRYLPPSILFAALVLCVPAHGEDVASIFSPGAWQSATQSPSDWSREAQVELFEAANQVPGMERDRIIALLGIPGYASESFGAGTGLLSRFDFYRLSAKNDRSYIIQYDADNKAMSGTIENIACVCRLCSLDAPVAAMEGLLNTILKKDEAEQGGDIKLDVLEKLLGHPGKHSVTMSEAGAQRWANYADVWRVAGKEHDFLLAEGAQPARDWNDDAFGTGFVRSYTLVTLMPDCLAR